MLDNWAFPIKLESEVAAIIAQQQINGVGFDKDRAEQYADTLLNARRSQHNELNKFFGYVTEDKDRTCARPFKPDGTYAEKVKKLLKGEDMPIAGPFTHIEMNPGSRQFVIKKLLEAGWKPAPDQYSEQGQPKLTVKGKPVESLFSVEGGLGNALADYYTIQDRLSTIIGWLYAVRDDGRITATANPLGTPTGRMTHQVVVNVPGATEKDGELIWYPDKQDEFFGTEMRSLFCVPQHRWEEGYRFLGYDASGLEARIMAHYLNDQKLIDIIVDPEGDFHQLIWDAIYDVCSSRGLAKGIEYALIYGASDAKLGWMADIKKKGWSDKKLGKYIRRNIMRKLPALDLLIQKVQKEAEQGFVRGLDGRLIRIRSTHSALNAKFQSAGAIVMKVALVMLMKEATKRNLDFMKVIDMHDEGQNEVHKKDCEEFGNLAVNSIKKAGQFLGVRCPLDAEYDVGHNWAMTH